MPTTRRPIHSSITEAARREVDRLLEDDGDYAAQRQAAASVPAFRGSLAHPDSESGPTPEAPGAEPAAERDFDELLDTFIDQRKLYRFEGESSLKNIEAIIAVLNPDYRNFRAFLADNPGCAEAILEWIREGGEKVAEWRDNLEAEVDDGVVED